VNTLFLRLRKSYELVLLEFKKPAFFIDKEAFEQYVKDDVFLNSHYELMYQSPPFQPGAGKPKNRIDFFSSGIMPDFVIRERLSGYVFAIEAKYRKMRNESIPSVLSTKELSGYRRFSEYHKVNTFLLLGTNGSPRCPANMFMIPLSGLDSTEISVDMLRRCELQRSTLYHPNYLQYLVRDQVFSR
jgi:hypothetical protein